MIPMDSPNQGLPEPLDTIFLFFKEGFVPVRVTALNTLTYDFDPEKERDSFPGITSGEFYEYGVLASKILNTPDLLYYTNSDVLQVVRIGVAPSEIKIFQEYPIGSKLNTLPQFSWSAQYTQFGGVSGLKTPYYKPTSKVELLVLPGTEPSFDFYNSSPDTEYPKLRLEIAVFSYVFLNDSNYLWQQINGVFPTKAKKYTLGNPKNLIDLTSIQHNLKDKGRGAITIPYSVSSPGDIVKAGGK